MSILVTAQTSFRLIQARVQLSSLVLAGTIEKSSMYTAVLAIRTQERAVFEKTA